MRPTIDASAFQVELRRAARLIALQIERAWPEKHRAAEHGGAALMTCLQLALHYWNCESFLLYIAENPVAGWMDEHSLVLPLIDRAMLETACNALFMIEDLEVRARLFNQAGWKDAAMEISRLEQDADPSDEATSRYLAQRRLHVDAGRQLFRVSAEQAEKPSQIHQWPTVTKMKDYGLKQDGHIPQTRTVLRHLVNSFYKELSGIVHGDGYGQLLQGGFAHAMQMAPEKREQLRNEAYPLVRATSLLRSSAFLLCIICEIQQYLGYREHLFEVKLLRIWEVIALQKEVREIYELRYKALYDLPTLL
ncbi:hypothetical protein [Terriglobus roseus]|uniref:Uncharacterized protein n=1 Tax=Terriglobus roseus TaxID=392734 RepID=A0A1H4QL65_9BACT|nr:hypothetical protein [Terriglobus roseus]SEC20297.1 hypothetical protein SAMN05443244_2902 [Terriglobus roseus]